MTVLRKGSKGEEVKQLQGLLHVAQDGVFGTLTEEALKAWQNENGLFPDGICGPKTWAKLLPEGKLTLKRSRRRIDYIAIHCTATPEGQDLTVEQIRKDHKAQGWADCGYHYIIYRDGTVHEGRDVDLMGAHVSGYNPYSIGIAYVGGLEPLRPGVAYDRLKAKDTRTEKQKAALLSLLQDLRRLYPKAIIQGHRDFSKDLNGNGTIEPSEWIKSCPSFDAKIEYRNI
jgi:N-acetyl-anhydromuramyl-L-alanine amidase AmpD